MEPVEDRFRAAKLGALAFWHSGCPGDLPAGACPFVLADGGDKVRGPAGCGEARITAGPLTDCAYGTTYYSVDRVLPLSECQEGMPAIRRAALDRFDDYWGDYAYMEDYLEDLAECEWCSVFKFGLAADLPRRPRLLLAGLPRIHDGLRLGR